MRSLEILKFKIDNFCLNYAVLGNGQTAIVIGSHKYYPRTFTDNLANKLQLICTDTRGFTPDNPSYVEADFTIDKITQDIEILRQSLKSDKVIIIGHSIHAFMAIEYVCKFPEKVSHLILIASSPIAGPKVYKEADQYFQKSACSGRKAAFTSSMKKFVASGNQSFVARMLAFGPMLWYDYNFDAAKLWEHVEVSPLGGEIIWGSMFANYDIAKALKAIQCPIFLALGRYDYFNPPYLWEGYSNYASDLTIHIFEKSSHTPQFEEPENFDEALLKWLEIKR